MTKQVIKISHFKKVFQGFSAISVLLLVSPGEPKSSSFCQAAETDTESGLFRAIT
jgi:hypothetical protein